MPKFTFDNGILQNTKNRTMSNAIDGYLNSDEVAPEQESKIEYYEVPLNEITPRPINRYEQTRIDKLAKSIRSTNNRLIHPIVLAKPEDLPEDSKTLQKFRERGVDVSQIKYMIVAGERRFRAWSLLQKEEQEAIDKSGFDKPNKFDTITANILTPKEAKNEEVYYKDSNTESRQLTPVEGMLNVRDALGYIQNNEDKRNALIEMNNGSDEGIDKNPNKAAKKFNMINYTMWYLENELGIKAWSAGTVGRYLAIVNNCDEEIIDAIIAGEFQERQARELTMLSKEEQLELLNLWKRDREQYDVRLGELSKLKKKSDDAKPVESVRTRDVYRAIKRTVNQMEKDANDIQQMASLISKKGDRTKALKMVEEFNKFIDKFNRLNEENLK